MRIVAYGPLVLIKAAGTLQFKSPKNDVPDTKCGQIYKNFNLLEAILYGIWPTFYHKKWEGVFIRSCNMMLSLSELHLKKLVICIFVWSEFTKQNLGYDH